MRGRVGAAVKYCGGTCVNLAQAGIHIYISSVVMPAGDGAEYRLGHFGGALRLRITDSFPESAGLEGMARTVAVREGPASMGLTLASGRGLLERPRRPSVHALVMTASSVSLF